MEWLSSVVNAVFGRSAGPADIGVARLEERLKVVEQELSKLRDRTHRLEAEAICLKHEIRNIKV